MVHVVADGVVAPEKDFILPFILNEADLHGRVVRLADTVNQILRQHDYPKPVANLLGEALILTALLSAALKFEGVFTLQAGLVDGDAFKWRTTARLHLIKYPGIAIVPMLQPVCVSAAGMAATEALHHAAGWGIGHQ